MNEQMKKNLRTAVQNFWGATSPEWIELAELLGRQPAAIGNEADDDIEEAREILENMVRSIELDGNYSTEATCTFLRQALNCLPVAAPLANEAGKPAAQQTLSDGAQFFACYLIDNCENEVVREESVQAWLGKMLASPRHHPAAPLVEQDEHGALPAWFDAFLVNVCEIPDRNSPDDEPEAIVATLEELKSCALNAIAARAASTSANVGPGAEAVQFVFPPMPQAVVMHEKLGPLFDRLSMQFYADKCMCIAAPPAQTATTDDARDAALWRYLAQHAVIVDASVEGMVSFTVAKDADTGAAQDAAARAIDMLAAQSASGDTK